jgi:hypothetical protein
MRLFGVVAAAAIFIMPGQALAQQGKPVVAIYQMDDVARTGQADTFSRMLETSITNTSKFRVIERERLNKLLGEQGRAKAGLVTTNKPGRTGGFEGADFLIYGSITTLSMTKKADFGSTFLANMGSRGGNASCSNVLVTLGIDIKITDADTGEVKYVTRVDEKQKGAAVCDGSSPIDAAGLMRAAADKVATGLVTTIYPIQIAAVQGDGTIVLNYGEGSVLPGSIMTVFSKGQAIIDPATGEKLGNDETELGNIQVTAVTGRISKAVAIGGFAGAPPVGSIVRPATEMEIDALKRRGKKR